MIRVERDGDEAAIDRVVAAAFGQRDEADLVRALRSDGCWLPHLSLVDVDEADAVRGHVAFTRAFVDGVPVLALAPLAVAPAHQRRGIGSTLVRAGLTQAHADGEGTVVVLGDPAYYGRFGFHPARTDGITGPFGDIDAFQSLVLHEPAARGVMVYAAPFGLPPD